MVKIIGSEKVLKFAESKNLLDDFFIVEWLREWDNTDEIGGYCDIVNLTVRQHPCIKSKGHCRVDAEWDEIAKAVGYDWFIDQTLACLDDKFGEIEYIEVAA